MLVLIDAACDWLQMYRYDVFSHALYSLFYLGVDLNVPRPRGVGARGADTIFDRKDRLNILLMLHLDDYFFFSRYCCAYISVLIFCIVLQYSVYSLADNVKGLQADD